MVYVINPVYKNGVFSKKISKRYEVGICIIDVVLKKGTINFKKIKKVVGNQPVVMPKYLTPRHGVCKYDSKNYIRKVMFNTVCDILKSTGSKGSLTLCYSDPFAIAKNWSKELVSLVGTLKVLTLCEDKYKEVSKEISQQFGTTPVVSSLSASATGFDFLYMPYEQEENSGPALYIKDIFCKYILDESCIEVKDFDQYNLKDISHADLAGALLTQNKVRKYDELTCRKLMHAGKKVEILTKKQVF